MDNVRQRRRRRSGHHTPRLPLEIGRCDFHGLGDEGSERQPWGYVLIGIGGGLLLFDRLFGLSSSWMRFIWASFEIDALLDEFRMRWVKTQLEAKDTQSPDTFRDFIAAAESAIKGIHTIVLLETSAWRAEFQSNITHHMSLWKSQGDNQASIDVHVGRDKLGAVRKS